ncbi:MAG TPA: hypothetical protein VKV26_00880 [Dehalococcoidia bacterium]|nr:hypothetical protein [Dehalococcoidia bacterium]
MAAYPALVQLIRLLGRADALAALGVESEPDPATLSATQRETLAALVDGALENIAAELAGEAASNDDVTDRAAGLAFIDDRIAAFADLLSAEQGARLHDEAARLVEDWQG